MIRMPRPSPWRTLLAATCVLLACAAAIAGTTGKITGTVTDPDGAPLPGVAVVVEGHRLGAVSDADGRYVILLVPPGPRAVTAQLIGYNVLTMAGVRVSTDLTSTVDFVLAEQAVEVEAMVVTAERPLIEADVTSSQTIVGAAQVATVPVAEVLDYLAYEPGVSVSKDNELLIRGGNASEIRFQVDDLDRTDALTSKGLTHLNLTLVSEVTLLTGGFNAEYGNMRSGVVNAVYKDGTERGWGLPWMSAVYSMAPTQRKHFGPGCYDRDQYDYRLAADPALTGARVPVRDSDGNVLRDGSGDPILEPLDNIAAVCWPDLFEETWDDTVFQKLWWSAKPQFEAFGGWETRALQSVFFGGFNKYDWTPSEMREVWQWQANMDEQAWRYAHEPDWNLDFSAGQALPNRLGGFIVGYSHARKMTPVPALRPYYTDRTLDMKLTLTPVDRLKVHLRYLDGANISTGAAVAPSQDLAETGGGVVHGNDPISLRDPGQLIGSISAIGDKAPGNKLNLSYNSLLDGRYRQIGGMVTYAFSPTTFAELGVARLETVWDQPRNPPRVDLTDFAGRYSPTNSYAWGGKNGFLHQITGLPVFIWKPLPEYERVNDSYRATGDTVYYPTHPDQVIPDNIVPRSPFDWRQPYATEDIEAVAAEARKAFVYKDFIFTRDDESVDTVRAVSPQGWVEHDVMDLSRRFDIGGHDDSQVFHHIASSSVFRGSVTHQSGVHTLKLGGEYTASSIDFDWQEGFGQSRDYLADPRVGGLYAQDKWESHGMVINVGLRADYFEAGAPAYTPDNIYDARFWRQGRFGGDILDSLSIEHPQRVWPLDPGSVLPIGLPFEDISFPTDPITPAELRDHIPQRAADTYWRLSPRAGISHPVSERTKLFFNYGHFYNFAQPKFMYGIGFYQSPMGSPQAAVRDLAYANLRPIRTTMYEVGVEQALPASRLLFTVRGYAKYNTDQVSYVTVLPKGGQRYRTYRNSNYENLQGLEVKLARMQGRILFGWVTYNYMARRSGQVGRSALSNDPAAAPQTWLAEPETNDSPDNFQALVGLRTPADWGMLRGGWSISLLQTWREGAEVVYNPENVSRRLLPAAYIMKAVDYWNTDVKAQKAFSLPGGRTVSAYVDVTNVRNTKRNRLGGTNYMEYLVDRRTKGSEPDLRYGDESTLHVFTRPYKDAGGNWHAPVSPRNDWVQFLFPRAYRFGLRVAL